MRRSITRRLMLMFAVTTLAVFALIGAALYEVLQVELVRHQREELQTAYQDVAYMLERVGRPDRWGRVQAKLDALSQSGDRVFWIDSADERFRYGTWEGLSSGPPQLSGYAQIGADGQTSPIYTLSGRIDAFEERPAVTLTVGVDGDPFEQTLHTFLTALGVLTLAAVALVVALGYCIVRLGLKPLMRLSSEASRLGAGDLSQRLSDQSLPSELGSLAQAFNGALDRLEQAYKQLEGFNADVAHELRTPLTNLIGETQVALSRRRTANEFQEVMQSNLEELERLRSIVNDMLFLARADQGAVATERIRTPVVHEISKTVDFFELILDESGKSIRIEGDTTAEAAVETALFRRAMANLLQNAIEHSREGGCIRVTIEHLPEQLLRIAVSNPSDTIEQEHLPRLFDRFYRVDAARHNRQTPGHGLGLAIVKAIVLMHGGVVFANSREGTTTIGFSIPL